MSNMNEKPKSLWKRPITGWWWFAARLVTFACLTVLMFFASLYCLSDDKSPPPPISIVWALSIGISLVLIFGWSIVRWLFCWRNFKRSLFALACFTTLIALFYAEEDWRGKHDWEKFKREWEAKGERFDLVSLAPPPVSDDQNLALAPLLKPIFGYTRVANDVHWQTTNGSEYLQNINAWIPIAGSTNDSPALGNLDKGTLADLEACANFYRGNTNYPQPARSGTAAEDILAALGKFDAEMKELHEAAAARPYCRFPVEYDYEMPAQIVLRPHLSRMKALSVLLEMRATALLELGRSQDALADLQLAFRLSDAIGEEPILISHLVRLAILSLDLQTVREGLVRHAWSDVQLAEIDKYLASVDLLAEYKHAMRGERACNVEITDWARRQEFKFTAELMSESKSFPIFSVFNLMPGGWYNQNMLAIARSHQNFTLAVVGEQSHRVFPEVSENQERAIQEMRTTPCNVFLKLLFPALSKASMISARGQTYVDAARIGCALERFRLANGQLPDALDALVPRFIDKIPNDVIDGQPLRYHKTSDGGYVVYSVGWNKTDDGGVVGWTEGKTPRVDPKTGDWVWRYPAK
jgi:tetratricopeptide (TPR) repeat protein